MTSAVLPFCLARNSFDLCPTAPLHIPRDASIRSWRRCRFPALEIPVLFVFSPLEYSPGASPRNAAYVFPFTKQRKSPVSTIRLNAVWVLIPRKQHSFFTFSRYSSYEASSSILRSNLSIFAVCSSKETIYSSRVSLYNDGSSSFLNHVTCLIVHLVPS